MIYGKRWFQFIKGEGLERVVKAIEQIKKEMRNSLWKQGKNNTWLIRAIRLEHLQIKKHQKIALKYLQQLDERMLEIEVKESRRQRYRELYKVK